MTLYEEVIAVSKPYFGPAAEQFITRQCQLHLQIDAVALTKTHLTELAKWVEVAGMRFLEEAKCKELAVKITRFGS